MVSARIAYHFLPKKPSPNMDIVERMLYGRLLLHHLNFIPVLFFVFYAAKTKLILRAFVA
jgi:hypothetical protein